MPTLNILSKSEIEKLIDEKSMLRFNHIYQELNLLRLKVDKLTEENKIMKEILKWLNTIK